MAAAHPLMSFVAGPVPPMRDVLFAVEGDRAAVAGASKIARELGAVPFTIRKDKKALYHAFGAFTSPLLIVHFATAERLALEAGVPEGVDSEGDAANRKAYVGELFCERRSCGV